MAKGKIRVWIAPQGTSAVMKSKECQEALRFVGNQVQARAGEGFVSEVKVHGNRAIATVRADTPKAYYTNLKHNTLLKASGEVKV